MAKKLYEKKMKIEVPLLFKKVDGHMARYEMPLQATEEGFVGNRTIDLDTRIFPAEYDPPVFEVTGKVVIEAVCREKEPKEQ